MYNYRDDLIKSVGEIQNLMGVSIDQIHDYFNRALEVVYFLEVETKFIPFRDERPCYEGPRRLGLAVAIDKTPVMGMGLYVQGGLPRGLVTPFGEIPIGAGRESDWFEGVNDRFKLTPLFGGNYRGKILSVEEVFSNYKMDSLKGVDSYADDENESWLNDIGCVWTINRDLRGNLLPHFEINVSPRSYSSYYMTSMDQIEFEALGELWNLAMPDEVKKAKERQLEKQTLSFKI